MSTIPQPGDDFDVTLSKLQDVSNQNINPDLQAIAKLALTLDEFRKFSSLGDLCTTTCETVYAFIIANQNLLQAVDKRGQVSEQVQQKMKMLHGKLTGVLEFSRTVASRNFVTAFFSYRWDAAKIQAFRMEMKEHIVTDSDFKPSLHIDTKVNRMSQAHRQSSPFVSPLRLKVSGLSSPKTMNSPFGNCSNASTPTLSTPVGPYIPRVYLGPVNSWSETNLVSGCGNQTSQYTYQSHNISFKGPMSPLIGGESMPYP